MNFSAEFCKKYDKLEEQVPGSFRELGNFLVVLADLYIVVDQTLPTPFLHHFYTILEVPLIISELPLVQMGHLSAKMTRPQHGLYHF